MIKVIYFDLGGVVVTDGFYRAAPLFAKKLGIDEKKIFDAYIKTDDWRYSAGKIGRERWENLFKELGIKVDVDEFIELWHSIFVPIEGTLKVVKKLKDNYRLGILSDQPKDLIPRLEDFGILDLFDANLRVISCEVGHGKSEPSKEIYSVAVEKAGVKPEEILFIDNNQGNLNDAAKEGIETLLFENPEQLDKDLDGLLRK